MANFTLKRKEVKTLRIQADDNSFEPFEIPLRGSLTVKEAMLLNTEEGSFSFFKKHIPAEVFDSLDFDGLNSIMLAWKKESDKRSRLNMGES